METDFGLGKTALLFLLSFAFAALISRDGWVGASLVSLLGISLVVFPLPKKEKTSG